MKTSQSFEEVLREAKRRLLRMHFESRVGHIGGNLSCLDILLSLYHRVLTPDDLFILSKGHAAGALYVALWSVGLLTEEDLRQFHGEGTLLSAHPPPGGIPEIPFATGSLGHGLSLAAGLALGKRFNGEPGRIVCLISDGELNEGSCWEAMAFIVTQKLDNVLVVVDANGLQGFGRTEDVFSLEPLAAKLAHFGLTTTEVNGHDAAELAAALAEVPGSGPRAVVARTVKGHGVSFMENRLEWHYLPLNEALFVQAIQEIDQKCATSSVALL